MNTRPDEPTWLGTEGAVIWTVQSALKPFGGVGGKALYKLFIINSWCYFSLQQLNVVKGEEYILLDNSNRTKWRVVNRAGLEGNVPGVCFLIPPPNVEAMDYAAQ